jgi:osmotically inducible protein OsmC
MNPISREVSVAWKDGVSAVTTGSGESEGVRFSLSAPLKNGSGIDPATLIAAAHAGSFSLALSQEVGAKAFAAGEIVVTALVTMEPLAAGWTVMNIHLKVVAKLPKVTQGGFIDAAIRAKTSCMVSRLLNAKISMNAKLENERPFAR